jgi:putative oxidoreductase
MERTSANAAIVARILVSVVFILNAAGVIDQSIPAKEMAEHGAPVALVPLLMFCGRSVELVAGMALAFGLLPRLAALALLAFLIPATFVAHSFWLAAGTPAFQPQLINFSKNLAMWGGLLFIGATAEQPAWVGSAARRLKGAMALSAAGRSPGL